MKDAVSVATNAHSLFTLMYVLYSSGMKSHTECVMLEHSDYFTFRLEFQSGGRGCNSVSKDVKASAFKETVVAELLEWYWLLIRIANVS